VKFIANQNPVREISLLTRPKNHKMRLFEVLVDTIKKHLPVQIKENKQFEIVPI